MRWKENMGWSLQIEFSKILIIYLLFTYLAQCIQNGIISTINLYNDWDILLLGADSYKSGVYFMLPNTPWLEPGIFQIVQSWSVTSDC